MKFSVFAIAALAAVTSSSWKVAVSAATVGRRLKSAKNDPPPPPPGQYYKKKSPKKNSKKSPPTLKPPPPASESSGQTPGANCKNNSDCAIPSGLDHGFCSNYDACQSGQPGSVCTQTSDCVVQNELDPPHAVCRGPSRGDTGTGANKISFRKCQR